MGYTICGGLNENGVIDSYGMSLLVVWPCGSRHCLLGESMLQI